MWKAFLAHHELSDPAVANGVVYVGVGLTPPRIFLPIPRQGQLPARGTPYQAGSHSVGIDAFSATCATRGGTCGPLWHGSSGGFYGPLGPVVADGELWATGGQENGPADLYAFGLPAR